jgi:hypothetical protein
LTALTTVLVLIGGVTITAGSAGATPRPMSRPTAPAAHPWPKDPAHNIKPKPDVNAYPSACTIHPTSKACGAKIVRALDHARHVLGKRSYPLPPDFLSLSGQDQLLTLTNDDRHSYGEAPVRGRNAALDKNAAHWAVRDQDPHGVLIVAHHHAYAIASNWAGGTGPIANPLFAYYEWMYEDGPGGHNADCQPGSTEGCWGHRHDTLYKFGAGLQVLMGVGTGKDDNGFTCWTELYESFRDTATMPMIATITDLSRHSGGTAGGTTVVVQGYGFGQAAWVHVLKQHARIVDRSNTRLTIKTPAHKAGAGYLVVHGSGGDSQHTAADKYRYHH